MLDTIYICVSEECICILLQQIPSLPRVPDLEAGTELIPRKGARTVGSSGNADVVYIRRDETMPNIWAGIVIRAAKLPVAVETVHQRA